MTDSKESSCSPERHSGLPSVTHHCILHAVEGLAPHGISEVRGGGGGRERRGREREEREGERGEGGREGGGTCIRGTRCLMYQRFLPYHQ